MNDPQRRVPLRFSTSASRQSAVRRGNHCAESIAEQRSDAGVPHQLESGIEYRSDPETGQSHIARRDTGHAAAMGSRRTLRTGHCTLGRATHTSHGRRHQPHNSLCRPCHSPCKRSHRIAAPQAFPTMPRPQQLRQRQIGCRQHRPCRLNCRQHRPCAAQLQAASHAANGASHAVHHIRQSGRPAYAGVHPDTAQPRVAGQTTRHHRFGATDDSAAHHSSQRPR